jgi:tellurite resistance protein
MAKDESKLRKRMNGLATQLDAIPNPTARNLARQLRELRTAEEAAQDAVVIAMAMAFKNRLERIKVELRTDDVLREFDS